MPRWSVAFRLVGEVCVECDACDEDAAVDTAEMLLDAYPTRYFEVCDLDPIWLSTDLVASDEELAAEAKADAILDDGFRGPACDYPRWKEDHNE